MAVFGHELGPATVEYSVECHSNWQCRVGRVRGWIADLEWDLCIEHSGAGRWTLNNQSITGLHECLDLDFGFTPATNLLQLRRVNLKIGAAAAVPVAWIDLPEATLRPLPQRYERRSSDSYWYESPTTGYADLLRIDESGFADEYPGLWQMVFSSRSA